MHLQSKATTSTTRRSTRPRGRTTTGAHQDDPGDSQQLRRLPACAGAGRAPQHRDCTQTRTSSRMPTQPARPMTIPKKLVEIHRGPPRMKLRSQTGAVTVTMRPTRGTTWIQPTMTYRNRPAAHGAPDGRRNQKAHRHQGLRTATQAERLRLWKRPALSATAAQERNGANGDAYADAWDLNQATFTRAARSSGRGEPEEGRAALASIGTTDPFTSIQKSRGLRV